MPTRSVGGGCYKWGNKGKKYCGAGAKAKADRQGRAIRASGYNVRDRVKGKRGKT